LHILLSSVLQVKENFERFISCKSTIDDIHVRLRKAEGDYGDSADGASTADMVAAVTDVSPPAKPLFMYVLSIKTFLQALEISCKDARVVLLSAGSRVQNMPC
jgi:hypothetical protein